MLTYQNRALLRAADLNYVDVVNKLLTDGCEVDQIDGAGDTPLIKAICRDNNEIVKLLCRYKANVNHKNNDGASPFSLSFFHAADRTIVQYLRQMGGHFDHELFSYIADGDETVFKHFKFDIEVQDSELHSLLHYAAAAGRLSLVQLFLKQGLTHTKDKQGNTPLILAAWNGQHKTVEWLLKNGGANISEKNCQGFSAIHAASINGHLEVLKLLVNEFHISVQDIDNLGNTPLLLAGHEGHLEIVRWLLKGLHPRSTVREYNRNGNNVFHCAILGGRLNVVAWLLSKKKVKKSDENKNIYTAESALHLAAKYGQNQTILHLLNSAYSTPNEIHTTDGSTALHFAAMSGKITTMAYLHEEGALINVTNSYGNTPLHIAAEHGQLEKVEWLVRRNITLLSRKNNIGATPFILASYTRELETAEKLLELGANIFDTLSNPVYTALDCLILHPTQVFAPIPLEPIVRFLLESGAAIGTDLTEHFQTDFKFDLKDIILIEATNNGQSIIAEGAIHTNDELREAILRIPLQRVPFLQRAINTRVEQFPNNQILKDTQAILGNFYTYFNQKLKKLILTGGQYDWPHLRKTVHMMLAKYPDQAALKETKCIIESLSSLKYQYLFFFADRPSFPNLQNLPQDLQEEINILRSQ